MNDSTPEFLFAQLSGQDVREEQLSALSAAIAGRRGEVLGCRSAHEVELLEPGTPSAAIIVARWWSREDFDHAWDADLSGLLDDLGGGRTDGLVLAMAGLPEEGLPDQMEVPTVASVPRASLTTPPTYMTIQGSVTDPVRIERYRDTILPMMKEGGAFYIVFSISGGAMRVLRGAWSEQIFAISSWPTDEAAHDFWYSDRYQNVAYPIRRGIGTFHVHLLAGRAG